jgi:S-adenosylmethionine synthetase
MADRVRTAERGEATAGKNALAHAGKIYSVLSHHLARRIR